MKWNRDNKSPSQTGVFCHSVMSDSVRRLGMYPASLLCPRGFSRKEYWSRLSCLPSGDLSDPGIEPRSPTLYVDSLSWEPPRRCWTVVLKNIGCFIFLEYKVQIHDNPSIRSCIHMTGFKSQLCHFLLVWSWSSYPLWVCDNGDTECIVHELLGGTKHPEQWLACSVCCVWHLS